jgi:hypothetical protein
MEVDAVLCNHAESVENKLYVHGGGVNMCLVAPQPPHVINVAVGLVVHVPYLSTNEPHRLLLVLVDKDGVPVAPYVPEGMAKPQVIRVEVPFTVGRPDILEVGDEQTLAMAANFPNLPLAEMGLFTWLIEIDDIEMRRLPFRVMLPPTPAPLPPG